MKRKAIKMWIIAAVFSSFFAGITAILAKCGIKRTDSDIATALRTIVVLVFSWGIVFLVGSQRTITQIAPRSLLFLVLSGMATGASWLCYFKALSLGDVNKVTAIDKSSTVLTVIIAMICFSETDHLFLRFSGILLLSVGTFLIIERKETAEIYEKNRKWYFYAVCSAVFAALTSILAKIGIDGVESNAGTAIRTAVVLIMAWLIVVLKGKQKQLKQIDRKECVFILLSGIATGVSWLFYYYAIQNGKVSVVVPIDKLSILVTVLFSWLFLKEKISRKSCAGFALMLCGTLIMAVGA